MKNKKLKNCPVKRYKSFKYVRVKNLAGYRITHNNNLYEEFYCVSIGNTNANTIHGLYTPNRAEGIVLIWKDNPFKIFESKIRY